jgi:tetratricopeptide (TPR) repeat protein
VGSLRNKGWTDNAPRHAFSVGSARGQSDIECKPEKVREAEMAICWKQIFLTGFVVMIGTCVTQSASAGDLKINIPRRSQLTPVQRLNREGVEAVKKHQLNKARELFYKAYLFDPGDPFTLNNLGYVAELEGQAERAQSLYAQAAAQATEARIDLASSSI